MWLGVDAGGSKTHAILLATDDRVVGEAVAGPGNPLSAGEDRALGSLDRAVTEALEGRVPQAAHFGVAGCGRPRDRARVMRVMERLTLECPLGLSDDARIAFHAAADPPGAILLCGTGSIAVAYDSHGRERRAGGHGYLLGDEGSAYWIAVEAVRAALRAADGRGDETKLVDLVPRLVGVRSLDDAVSEIYSGRIDRAVLARLAPEIVSLDDSVARSITRAALDELTTTVVAVTSDMHDFPLVLAGGMLGFDSPFQTQVEAQLGSALRDARILRASHPPAYGAARLAQRAVSEIG